MRFTVRFLTFIFLLNLAVYGQELSRTEKIEALKKYAAQMAEMERQMTELNLRRRKAFTT